MLSFYKKALLLSAVLTAGLGLSAQENPDSVMKKLVLKEVQIQGYRLTKHPAGNFYQTSSLASTEDILSRIEGVSLVRRGPIGLEPILRSFSAGQINVVIDGMKIFGACTDKMDPVTIYVEPSNLKSIDIKHGGDGIAMGAAIGGSLNMKLADAVIDPDKKLSGSLASGYYTAAKAVQNILTMSYSADKWAFRVSGVYRKADNYRNGAGEKVDFSQYEKANISISGKYQLDKNKTLKADFLLDDGWNIGYPALPMDVGYARARIGALTYQQHKEDYFLEHIEAKIYANSIRHAMDDTQRPSVPMHMDMPGWSDTQGAFVQTETKTLGKHRFNFKADIYHNRVKADMTMYPEDGAPMYMLTWPENHQTVAGLFAEDRILLNEKNALNFKLRMDASFSKISDEMGRSQFDVLGYDVSRTNLRFLKNISAGYTHYLDENFTFYASAGYDERQPATSERYGFYLFNRMDNHDYIGNPNLKNEHALNAELNLIFSKNNLSWKVSGFASRIQHYILGKTRPGLSVMTIGASGVRSYENIPSAFITGAESSFNYKFWEQHFTLNNTLKFLHGSDHAGEPLPLIAPLKSVTGLRFTHHHLFIQAENETSIGQNRINRDFGETETPGYSIINLRGAYSFKLKKYNLELSAGAENIFDRAYYEHLDWGKMPRPGRNIYTMLSLKF